MLRQVSVGSPCSLAHPSRCLSCQARMALLAAAILALAAPSVLEGAEWIPFGVSSEVGTTTVFEMRAPSLDSAVIDVLCPGILLEEVTREGAARLRPSMPGEKHLDSPGSPLIPAIWRIIAVPEYESVSIAAIGKDSVVVPIGADIIECGDPIPLGSGSQTEPHVQWENSEPYPGKLAEISGEARIRDLRVVCISVYPVQYVQRLRHLICYRSIRVSLRFEGSSPSLAVRGTGPFENICKRNVIGYKSVQGHSAVPPLSSGQWGRCDGEEPLQCCIDMGTDYLIIAASEFFRSEWIDSLASKRASYNNFNVSVVNVDSLGMNDATPDSAVRSFVKTLYDAGTAAHMPDGHLAFVLLAGSFKGLSGDTLVPVHLRHTWTLPKYGYPEFYPSDNWYADVDDLSCPYPDLFIGRFCARDAAELRVLVQKTLNWEPLPADPSGWSSTIFLTCAPPYKEYREPYIPDAEAVEIVFGEIRELAEEDASYTIRELRGQEGQADSLLLKANVDSLNAGAAWMCYLAHSDDCGCDMGDGPPAFTCSSVDGLTNGDSLCVIFTITCIGANFAPRACPSFSGPCPDSMQSESIGVKFTIHPGGGAVAFIGPTDAGAVGWWGRNGKSAETRFFTSILKHHTPFVAEALVETKLLYGGSYQYCQSMSLLGDPALNVKLRAGSEHYCDLGVSSAASDMIFDPADLTIRPKSGICSTTVWVRNKTHIGVPDVPISVKFEAQAQRLGEWIDLGISHVDSIAPWGADSVRFAWSTDSLPVDDVYTFRVCVDEEDTVKFEAYESNNVAEVDMGVGIAQGSGVYADNLGAGLRSPTAGYFLVGGDRRRLVVTVDTEGLVYPIDPDGDLVIQAYPTQASNPFPVALGDLEKDGRNLQVVAGPTKVIALDIFDQPSPVKWSVAPPGTVTTPPSLGDFDRDPEADLEVAVGYHDSLSYVCIIGTGQILSTWELGAAGDYGVPTSLLLLDLDSNDTLDIIAGTSAGYLFAVHGVTGETFWRYSLSRLSATAASGPVAGDIDWDGHMEVIAGGDSVYVFAAATSCSLLACADLDAPLVSVSLGELDESWECLATEIIACYDSGISVLRYTTDGLPALSEVARHDLESRPTGQAVVGDVYETAYHEREVFFVCENDIVHMLYGAGNHLAVLRTVGSSTGIPLIYDMFKDDDSPDLVFVGEGGDNLCKVEGDGGELSTDWAMVANDPRHTGVYAYTITGSIENDQVWWGRYRIPELTVRSTLTIEPGTRIEMGEPRGDPWHRWWEGALRFSYGDSGFGGLTAHGTEEEPILFTTAAPSTYPLMSSWSRQWSGIHAESYGPVYPTTFDLTYCIIEDASAGLLLYYWYPLGPAGFVSASRCKFLRCGVGIWSCCWWAFADSCEFIGNEDGVWGDAGASNSSFIGNSIGAMDVNGGSIGNTVIGVDGSYGISVHEYNPCSGLIDCDPLVVPEPVWDNTVDSCGQEGMIFNSIWDSTFIVQRNAVRNCGIGMHFKREPHWACSTYARWAAVVTDTNGITNCNIAVYCDSAAIPIMGTASDSGYNDIWNVTIAGVNEDDLLAVPARHNWWGFSCADSDTVAEMFVGEFDIQPCLNQPIWGGIGETKDAAIGQIAMLQGMYPNPARTATRIQFELSAKAKISIVIYDVMGRKIKHIVNGTLPEGRYDYHWDGTDQDGDLVASGIYFCHLSCRKIQATRKVVLLR